MITLPKLITTWMTSKWLTSRNESLSIWFDLCLLPTWWPVATLHFDWWEAGAPSSKHCSSDLHWGLALWPRGEQRKWIVAKKIIKKKKNKQKQKQNHQKNKSTGRITRRNRKKKNKKKIKKKTAENAVFDFFFDVFLFFSCFFLGLGFLVCFFCLLWFCFFLFLFFCQTLYSLCCWTHKTCWELGVHPCPSYMAVYGIVVVVTMPRSYSASMKRGASQTGCFTRTELLPSPHFRLRSGCFDPEIGVGTNLNEMFKWH